MLLCCLQVTAQGADALEQQNLDLAAEVARVEMLTAEVRHAITRITIIALQGLCYTRKLQPRSRLPAILGVEAVVCCHPIIMQQPLMSPWCPAPM